MRTGIVGIERIIEKKQRETDKEVSQVNIGNHCYKCCLYQIQDPIQESSKV